MSDLSTGALYRVKIVYTFEITGVASSQVAVQLAAQALSCRGDMHRNVKNIEGSVEELTPEKLRADEEARRAGILNLTRGGKA